MPPLDGAPQGMLGEHGVGRELVVVAQPDAGGHLVLDREWSRGARQVQPEAVLALFDPITLQGAADLLAVVGRWGYEGLLAIM